MSEQYLLMVFIGLVALALVAIAAAIVAVGWQTYKLIAELRSVLERVRQAGEVAAADIDALRVKIKNESTRLATVFDVVFGALLRKVASPRRAKKPTSVEEE